MTRFAQAIAVASLLLAAGCAERRIFVTSEPPGATVIVNDVNVGQTPVEVDFLYYGVYDVRLHKPGFEPVLTSERVRAPLHEWPGFDAIAAVIPGREKKHVYWHYTLAPAETDADALIARAGSLRDRVTGRSAERPAAGANAGEEPIVVDEFSEIESQSTPPPIEPPARDD